MPVNTGASLISVFRSEAKDLLGDDWVQRHRRTVPQTCKSIQKECLGKGDILPNEATSESSVSEKIILSSYL